MISIAKHGMTNPNSTQSIEVRSKWESLGFFTSTKSASKTSSLDGLSWYRLHCVVMPLLTISLGIPMARYARFPARMHALVSSLLLLSSATAVPTLIDVFSKGLDGYACYRIPALLRLSNSTLVLFAEGRYYSCNDHGYVDLVSKTSTDNGATWGPLAVVHSESSKRGTNVTIGNAAPVLLSTGRILLPFSRNNLEAAVLYSDDAGHRWATLANISQPPAWTWVATGPPGSLELSPGGRIVVPADHQDPVAGMGSHTFFSDDGGLTWAVSTYVAGGDECQAAPLPWVGPQVCRQGGRGARHPG